MPRPLPIPLPLLPYMTVMRSDLPPVEWIIEGIIAQGDRVVLYGEFGSMKSWLLLDMGIHIAAGQCWLNEFNVPEPKRVLFIDEEMNVRTLHRRIRRLGDGMDIQTENIPFMAMSQVGVTFDEGGANSLLDALRRSNFDPDIVIIETLRRVMRGSENEAEAVSAFWRNVEPLRQAGKTIVISHHMRKPSADSRSNENRNRASGSTDILAGADTGFAIQRQRGGNSIFVECVKSREAEEVRPFWVAFQSSHGQHTPVSLAFECYRAAGDQQSTTAPQRAQQLIEVFLAARPDRTATTAEILAHLTAGGIPERTGTRALNGLGNATNRLVYRVRRGVWALRQEVSHEA